MRAIDSLKKGRRWLEHRFWMIYEKPFVDQYPNLLAKYLKDCTSVLDVGCGSASPLAKLGISFQRTVGVEAFDEYLHISRQKKTHHEYLKADILKLDSYFEAGSFDAVLCSDVIEHLLKKDGFKLLSMMETIAKKKVIVFTPNGFFPQEEKDGNPHQKHLSGWTVSEMKSLGFEVIMGVHGLKILCKKYPEPLFKPYAFWRGLSTWTQPFVINWPQQAFQILCIKKVG